MAPMVLIRMDDINPGAGEILPIVRDVDVVEN